MDHLNQRIFFLKININRSSCGKRQKGALSVRKHKVGKGGKGILRKNGNQRRHRSMKDKETLLLKAP